MKNRVLLENKYLPGDLERQIGPLSITTTNESLNNVTPADAYFRRDKTTLRDREKIKKTDDPPAPLAPSKTGDMIDHEPSQSLQCSNRSQFPFYMTKDSGGYRD